MPIHYFYRDVCNCFFFKQEERRIGEWWTAVFKKLAWSFKSIIVFCVNTIHKYINTIHKYINTIHFSINTIHKYINTIHFSINTIHKYINTIHKYINTIHKYINTIVFFIKPKVFTKTVVLIHIIADNGNLSAKHDKTSEIRDVTLESLLGFIRWRAPPT